VSEELSTGISPSASTPREGRSGSFDLRLVSLAMLLTVVCTMPLWLVSALSVQMRADLG
jgi:hypothetical protein